MKRCILITSLLFSWNCFGWQGIDADHNPTQDVSYCELAKNPTLFAGKRIRVRAIYTYGFEIQRLDPPSCCQERQVKIWVEILTDRLKGQSLQLFHKLPRDMGRSLATFEGTFESGGPYADGYRFRVTIDKIEKLEAAAKPSSLAPKWLPQNCETPSAAPLQQ
jgi:hypothetical protein